MKGSIQIARIFGIPLLLHWTFGLLLLYIIFLGRTLHFGIEGTLSLGLTMMSLFLCVVLHEFGHALMARRFNVETKDIVLLPIGGMARLRKLPEKPIQEFLVAIAGPLVNVVIAICVGVGIWLFADGNLTWDISKGNELYALKNPRYFWTFLLWMNIALVVFNLIPAFPMDGGRVFRALLSLKLTRLKATRFATILGQIFAVAFIVFGAWEWQHPILIFIGMFIFFMASQEYRSVHLENYLLQHTVGEIARIRFTRLFNSTSINEAFNHYLRNIERNFLVFDESGNFTGILSEKKILTALKNAPRETPVEAFLEPHFHLVTSTDSLQMAYELIFQKGYKILLMMEGEKIIGVIDSASLNHFLRMRKLMNK